MDQKLIVGRLSRMGIWGNVILSLFKLFAGIAGHSSAMISDAVHSISDVFATFVAWLGVRLAAGKADREHPYGHERFECVASLILGLILAVTALEIGESGIRNILSGAQAEREVPTVLPLAAAIISIAVKEGMFRYTMHYAKALHSQAFQADAWHHRSDALSSVASLIGIIAARIGFGIAEPITMVIICLFILKVAFDILKSALDGMLDTSCDVRYEQSLTDYLCSDSRVLRVDVLRTRKFGSRVFVEAEIAVDSELSLREAHDIAETLHDGVERDFPDVKHVLIHVNPMEA